MIKKHADPTLSKQFSHGLVKRQLTQLSIIGHELKNLYKRSAKINLEVYELMYKWMELKTKPRFIELDGKFFANGKPRDILCSEWTGWENEGVETENIAIRCRATNLFGVPVPVAAVVAVGGYDVVARIVAIGGARYLIGKIMNTPEYKAGKIDLTYLIAFYNKELAGLET